MTREEAIKGLKSLVEVRRKYGDMQTMKDEIECLDMAIRALENEKTDGDLISRKAIKNLIRSLTKWSVRSQDRKFENVGLLYDDVMFGIDRLPSAEKTAEWKPLDKEKAQYYMFGYVCSKCGAPAKSPTKYCSNCGANMHGGNPG